jgi:hypothetical protein
VFLESCIVLGGSSQGVLRDGDDADVLRQLGKISLFDETNSRRSQNETEFAIDI